MVQRMSYFRFKRRTLGPAYERFLRDCLKPEGLIIVMECGLPWPTTRRGERYVFQFGALGGATPEEMMLRGGACRSLSAPAKIRSDPMGAAHPGWDQPRGRVGVCAGASRGHRALRPTPQLSRATDRLRTAGGHESAGGRSLSMVVRAVGRGRQSAGRRLLHLDGALLDDPHPLRPVLDGLQYGGLVPRPR